MTVLSHTWKMCSMQVTKSDYSIKLEEEKIVCSKIDLNTKQISIAHTEAYFESIRILYLRLGFKDFLFRMRGWVLNCRCHQLVDWCILGYFLFSAQRFGGLMYSTNTFLVSLKKERLTKFVIWGLVLSPMNKFDLTNVRKFTNYYPCLQVRFIKCSLCSLGVDRNFISFSDYCCSLWTYF